MIEANQTEGDDVDFLGSVNCIAATLARNQSTEKLYLVRLDNWFGPKWLQFSGKILGALGVWKGELTVPPFVPGRVVEEKLWAREQSRNNFSVSKPTAPVHRKIPSNLATKRWIIQEYPSAAFLWFSGNTKRNGKGAIMVYTRCSDGDYWCWYAELSATKQWQPSFTRGISQSEFRSLSSSVPPST